MLSSTIADVITYQIAVAPAISPYKSISKSELVQLTASSSGGTASRWTLSSEQLTANLARIIGKASAREVLECLRGDQIIRLPGTYTSCEVMKLGYRKPPPDRTVRVKRKAGSRWID